MSKEKIKFTGSRAMKRYAIIPWLVLLFFVYVTYKILVIKYVEGPEWRKIGEKLVTYKEVPVQANRGNIYGQDYKLLAASIPEYKIYIDFNADGVRKDSVSKYIDTLSVLLATHFHGKGNLYNRAYYKKKLTAINDKAAKEKEAYQKAKKNKTPLPRLTSRRFQLIPYEIDFLEYQKMRTFPYLNRNPITIGMYTELRTERLKPFGNIAGRTIGSLDPDPTIGGRSGMELKYDSILKGVDGLKTKHKIGGMMMDQIIKEPVDGKDILITINIDYQDITEKALLRILKDTKAKSGCAVLIETKTGEIKAISNLDRISNDVYGEGKPNVFSYMFEPGSTFKTVSLLVALDDKIVTPNSTFNGGTGKIQYGGRTIIDHDANKSKDKTNWTVRQGMANSSNTIISQMILKGYEDHPEKFVEKIRGFGLGQNLTWDVPLKGREGTTNIRSPKDPNARWYKTALPWMSFGYETQVPPIYLAMFYNAIANNGKMLKPFLYKGVLENGKLTEEHKAEVINSSIASKHALKDVQDILRYVVTDGTGKAAGSEIVNISGKTGTTKLSENGAYSRNYYVSFAGYFPSEAPKYTIYVGIERPEGYPSGAMPGAVFKEIAEKVTIRESISDPILPNVDTIHQIMPKIHNGLLLNALLVLNELDIDNATDLDKNTWAIANEDEVGIKFDKTVVVETNVMPNVKNMGLKDAIFILESQGLKVKSTGFGKVTKQSIEPGTPIKTGNTVTIYLEF